MSTPLAPTLLTPVDGEHVDGATSTTFTWIHNDPDPGDDQSAYALRRKVAGSGSYEYWNGSSWAGTIAWNTTGTQSATILVANWSNDATRQWSVATKDTGGTAGPFAPDRLIISRAKAVVDVTQPAGSQATSRPTVAWAYTQADGFRQKAYQVKVFDAATYGGGGFDPDTSTPVWESGWVNDGFAYTVDIGTDLEDGVSYRAYVQAVDTYGLESAWDYSGFSSSLSLPGSPTVTIDHKIDLGVTDVTVRADFNLLPNDEAIDFETGDGDWTAKNNCTLSQSGTRADHGLYSLKMVADGATYEQLNAAHTDFAAENTAYTDFAAQSAATL